MNERRVRFTETASNQVDHERIWWLANRDYQELFATELENALQIVAVLPGLALHTRGLKSKVCDESTFVNWPATCTTRLMIEK